MTAPSRNTARSASFDFSKSCSIAGILPHRDDEPDPDHVAARVVRPEPAEVAAAPIGHDVVSPAPDAPVLDTALGPPHGVSPRAPREELRVVAVLAPLA